MSGHILKIAFFRIFKRKTALFSDTISRNKMLCANCPYSVPGSLFPLRRIRPICRPSGRSRPYSSGLNVYIYIYLYIALFPQPVRKGCSFPRSGSVCRSSAPALPLPVRMPALRNAWKISAPSSARLSASCPDPSGRCLPVLLKLSDPVFCKQMAYI